MLMAYAKPKQPQKHAPVPELLYGAGSDSIFCQTGPAWRI